ncbi:Nif3-like dinuclear metal center hexameric protein [Desulfovermiculus halophilus]|uniref:Nif3-like dinuclear metal center hexameric protein n=1 Tax=Desulfovermiculus halophilus TaxID=339722 RepID=UPI0004872B52|nr:Nif3-like dinuclear metal center hexameric protein [Desulfovermiculus halophilus]
MQITELIAAIEQHADPALAADWDNSGMQVAGSRDNIRRLALTLDPRPDSIRTALDWDADFILAHHPLTLTPRLPNRCDDFHSACTLLLQSGVGLYSAHTSLDVQTLGPPGWLARALNCSRIRPILPMREPERTWLCINHSLLHPGALDSLITHPACIEWTMSDTECCILIPEAKAEDILQILAGSTSMERVRAVKALPVHIRQGYGVMGRLPEPMTWPALAQTLSAHLPGGTWIRTGTPPERIQTLAYCPGSGMDLAGQAFAQGADVFLSGDLKYHQAQEIEPLGLTLDVGHFSLEEKMMAEWAQTLDQEFTDQDLEVEVGFIPGHNPLAYEDRS